MDTELITHRFESQTCILKINKKIGVPVTLQLSEYVESLFQNDPIRALVINLEGQRLVDSALIGLLMGILKDCQARHIKYGLCEANEDVIMIFQHVKLDQFLGVFKTEAEVLQTLSELEVPSKISSKTPHEKARDSTTEMFYLVGPKLSWKFSRKRLKGMGIFAGVVFLSVCVISIYQYYFYQSLFRDIQQQQDHQNFRNQELGKQIQELEQKHIILEQQIDQKKFLLSVAKQPALLDQQEGEVFREQETKKLKQIADLQQEGDEKTKQITQLQQAEKQAEEKIRLLFQEIAQLKRQLQKQSTSPPTTIPSIKALPMNLIIDQFRLTSNNDTIRVQFNLRNVGNESNSGRIMIRALRENELNQTIPYNTKNTITFRIRRFRSFSKDFTQNQNDPYTAIRLIVWDTKRKKTLEEHFPIQ